MTESKLKGLYFDWLCDLVCDDKHSAHAYRKLLMYLYKTDFVYTIPMDGNRFEDGIDMRYRFGSVYGYDEAMTASYLDNCPCSILEMMTALAVRCEEHIMWDPDIGDRTGKWFDYGRADFVISKFLNREYDSDGNGGLFKVKNCKQNLNSAEIWYQMCLYLDSII